MARPLRFEFAGAVYPSDQPGKLIDIISLWVNSRQAVFSGKLDDPLSFHEKTAIGDCQNPVDSFLFYCFKGAH